MRKISRRARTAVVSTALTAGLATALAVGLPAANAGTPDGGSKTSAGKQRTQPEKYVFTTLTASGDSVDFDNRELRVSGRLFVANPDGQPGKPAANQSVDVVQAWENPYRGNDGDTTVYTPLGEVTTDGQGKFTLENAEVKERDKKEHMPVPGDFDVRLQAGHRIDPDGFADPSNWDGTGSWPGIKGHPSEAQMEVNFGKGEPTPEGTRRVSVEGTLERRGPESWQPLVGQLVSLQFTPNEGDSTDDTTLTTGDEGEYSGKVTATSDGTVNAGATSWYDDAFLDLPEDQRSTPVDLP